MSNFCEARLLQSCNVCMRTPVGVDVCSLTPRGGVPAFREIIRYLESGAGAARLAARVQL